MPQSSYPTDTLYPTRYFRELSPAWLNYVAHLGGASAPALEAPFRYLELGCGTGLSGAIHAAAFPRAEFHLCDFNSACIDAARHHARRLGADNVSWLHRRFTELAAGELPPFDYIVLHGVWSWVDGAEQRALLALLQQRLRPGGLVYVSYNCLPGWAAELPLVYLSQRLAGAVAGDSTRRVAYALDVLEQLSGGGLRYFAESSAARDVVSAWRRTDTDYLVHELLSPGSQPRYATDVHRQMTDAGLRFVGSATLADNHAELQVDARTGELIGALPTAALRDLALDFAVNRRFRRDVFVRQHAGLPSPSHRREEAATDPVIGSLSPEPDPKAGVLVPRGRLSFDAAFIRAAGDLLAQRPRPLHELVACLAGARHDRRQVLRNLRYAVAGGLLTPFARTSATGPMPPEGFSTSAVERIVREAADAEDATVWIPSPITGGGVPLRSRDALRVLRALDGRCRDGDRALLRHLQQLALLR